MIPVSHSRPYTRRPHAGSSPGPPHHLPRAAVAALLPAPQNPAAALLRGRRPCPGEGQTGSTPGGWDIGGTPTLPPPCPPCPRSVPTGPRPHGHHGEEQWGAQWPGPPRPRAAGGGGGRTGLHPQCWCPRLHRGGNLFLMPPAWGSRPPTWSGVQTLVGHPQTGGECQRTGAWVSVGRLLLCPSGGSGTMAGGCWSGAPSPGRDVVWYPRPSHVPYTPLQGWGLPTPLRVPPATPVTCLCVWCPPINGSGAQVSEGPQEQPTPCCVPGPPAPPALGCPCSSLGGHGIPTSPRAHRVPGTTITPNAGVFPPSPSSPQVPHFSNR